MFLYCGRRLELGKVMPIRVSNDHRGLLGLEITRVRGGHLGVVRVVRRPMKLLEGQVAHRAATLTAPASPDIKNGAYQSSLKNNYCVPNST
jgi:hypothetical protein